MAAGRGRGGQGRRGGTDKMAPGTPLRGLREPGAEGPEGAGGSGLGGAASEKMGGGREAAAEPGIKWRPRRASPGGKGEPPPPHGEGGGHTKRPRRCCSGASGRCSRLRASLLFSRAAGLRAARRRQRPLREVGARLARPLGGEMVGRGRLAPLGPRGAGLPLFFLFFCFPVEIPLPLAKPERERPSSPPGAI